MESLLKIVKGWKATAREKQQEAIRMLDSHESNHQLGKIAMCEDFIYQLEKEIEEEKATSQKRDKQSV
jgi:hypothetical protein